jgi:hypothetical protein
MMDGELGRSSESCKNLELSFGGFDLVATRESISCSSSSTSPSELESSSKKDEQAPNVCQLFLGSRAFADPTRVVSNDDVRGGILIASPDGLRLFTSITLALVVASAVAQACRN